MTWNIAILLIISNVIAWFFFHYFISYVCLKIPLAYFLKDVRWGKLLTYEENGAIWHKLFHVRRWKGRIIEGSSIVKSSYNKKHLHGIDKENLTIFAAETKRAELTHWLLMIPGPLFFLWNPVWAGWIMIGYAIMVNFPFIIVQRYNRGRIEKIIERIR